MTARNPPVLLAPDHNKCSRCRPARCCGYLTQQIPTPRSMQDFDHLLWQIAHHAVCVYQDADGWYLLINMPCRHLLPQGGCAIYAERPRVCRTYSNEFCEYDARAEDSFKRFFDSYEALLAYCRQRFMGWDRRFDRV